MNTVNIYSPKSINVLFSESKLIQMKNYDFTDFELLALEAAKQKGIDGAYKVEVVAELHSKQKFQCTLCLALDADCCFSHYMTRLKGDLADDSFTASVDKELINIIEKIDTTVIDMDMINATIQNELQAIADKKAQEQRAQLAAVEEQKEKARQSLAEFRQSLNIPADTKAVIIAKFTEYDHDNSDPMGDYHTTKTKKTILLAWSTHERDIFSELRKAALNHPDTAYLADKDNGTEHREKYSMGKGYYLTNKEYIWAGVEIKKIKFYTRDKAQKVDRVPMGEMAIPGYEPLQTQEADKLQAQEQGAEHDNAIIMDAMPCDEIELVNDIEPASLVLTSEEIETIEEAQIACDIIDPVAELLQKREKMIQAQVSFFKLQKAALTNIKLSVNGSNESQVITCDQLQRLTEQSVYAKPVEMDCGTEQPKIYYYFHDCNVIADLNN